MKKIKKTISYLAGITLISLALLNISFKNKPTETRIPRLVNSSALVSLPCGFTSKATVTYSASSSFIGPNTMYPILSRTGSYTLPPPYTAGTQAIPTTMYNGSGADKIILQSDGNLVIYHGSTALWSSNTNGSGAQYLFFQADGNLVLTNGDPSRTGTTVYWASNIYSSCSGSQDVRLIFQNDGNLVYLYPTGGANQWYQLADTGSGGQGVSTHFGSIY
ncbi:D-mannose binding lectin [Mucilaginibacter gracilis]|uniref:D-mannose binding lectin n=1 Tax=Mucilaginibacter gracilis TaxID=423350 RepID=A0A495IYC2_9SPHI|nr:hypothetical protein [Mucilaginibacter gracilis]RKR81700.1 D-mannose binding lectin [Mucilaginibacter gracilis]